MRFHENTFLKLLLKNGFLKNWSMSVEIRFSCFDIAISSSFDIRFYCSKFFVNAIDQYYHSNVWYVSFLVRHIRDICLWILQKNNHILTAIDQFLINIFRTTCIIRYGSLHTEIIKNFRRLFKNFSEIFLKKEIKKISLRKLIHVIWG